MIKNSVELTIEIVLYGFMISLIIHQYFFQSFKVTTSSMEPTLIGDAKSGDRILVKKYAYGSENPKRWDIPVFRYPHNNRKIFIKRLVGLPGENIHIRNGDIYINRLIARKPAQIIPVLLYPLYVPTDYLDFDEYWKQAKGWESSKDKIIAKAENKSWRSFIPSITNRYTPENNKYFLHRKKYAYPVGGGEVMGEIRFETKVIKSSSGSLYMEVREGQFRFVCTIDIDKNSGHISQYSGENTTAIATVPFIYKWLKAKSHKITFSNIDDLVTLHINNQSICSLDYSIEQEKAPKFTYDSSFRWGIANGHFEFSGIKLWRDIYYIPKRDFFGGLKSFQIPNNRYFVLGDNPPNSRDSKDWKRFTFFFHNGISVQGDQKAFPHGQVRKFTDIYGYDRVIENNKLREDYLSRQESPFVSISDIMGKAVIVYWPPNRAKIVK